MDANTYYDLDDILATEEVSEQTRLPLSNKILTNTHARIYLTVCISVCIYRYTKRERRGVYIFVYIDLCVCVFVVACVY